MSLGKTLLETKSNLTPFYFHFTHFTMMLFTKGHVAKILWSCLFNEKLFLTDHPSKSFRYLFSDRSGFLHFSEQERLNTYFVKNMKASENFWHQQPKLESEIARESTEENTYFSQ